MAPASQMRAALFTLGGPLAPDVLHFACEPAGEGVVGIDVRAPLDAVLAFEGRRAVESDRATIVANDAPVEGAVLVGVTVQLNDRADKGVAHKIQLRSFAADKRQARETAFLAGLNFSAKTGADDPAAQASVVRSDRRVDLVNESLDGRDARVVVKANKCAAFARRRLLQLDLAVGHRNVRFATWAIELHKNVIEFAGHAGFVAGSTLKREAA